MQPHLSGRWLTPGDEGALLRCKHQQPWASSPDSVDDSQDLVKKDPSFLIPSLPAPQALLPGWPGQFWSRLR